MNAESGRIVVHPSLDPEATKEIVNDVSGRVSSVIWHGVDVSVKYMISPVDMSSIVNDTVSSCYSKGGDAFVPEMLDFSERMNVISLYTDFILPTDVYDRYYIVCGTDLYDLIVAHICEAQLESIKKAIRWCVSH